MTTTIDIDTAVETIGMPFEHWAAQCHAVSLAFVKEGLVEGRVARGFCEGVGGQHSWIVLGDDCYADDVAIVDPTLWSYRDDVEGIWYGNASDGLHVPHGKGPHIMQLGRPAPPDDPADAVALTPKTPLSSEAVFFLDLLGPLDRGGWIRLSDTTVTGWPAAEIIAAMDDTIELRGLVPIDRLGMLTDRNPSGLYLIGDEVEPS